MIEAVEQKNIIWQFIVWHFYEMPQAILKGWFNFLYFTLRYFSFGFLLKTFFSHWHKYKDSYGRGFDLKIYSQTFIFNMISRLLGVVLRTFIILAGVVFGALVCVAGVLVLVFWLLMPVIILFSFGFSAYLLI